MKINEDSVVKDCLFASSKLPLLLTPRNDGIKLLEWIGVNDNVSEVMDDLREFGGILFRGFNDTTDTESFRRFCESFPAPLLKYTEQSSPRQKLQKNVYTSTTYPPDQYIPFHNANSFGHEFPLNIWFSCIRKSDTGGRKPAKH